MKKFAFIIHPREIDDFSRRIGCVLGINDRLVKKILPKCLTECFLKHLKGRVGFTICSHFDVWGQAEGYIIAVLLTARQMMELPRQLVQDKIINAILFAQNKLRVERVGLGAYTAPMTKGGLSVIEDPKIKCAITHGGSFSAASVIPAVKQGTIIKKINIQNSTIAVVGAYGIVGRAASILLTNLIPQKIILIGPRKNKLREVKDKIEPNYSGKIQISVDNTIIKEADIVVLCTTARGTIVTERTLKRNAIVVDMAQPHNMGKKVCRDRPDVLRIDGGYISIPNINLNFKMGSPDGVTFACLTEVIVSTLIGDTESHVGPVNTQFAEYIFNKGNKLGFKLAPFTNFSKLIAL